MKRTKKSYQFHGLTVYVLSNGQEWAVGDDTDKTRDAKHRTRVDRAARRAVLESLWAFNSDFIASFLVSDVKHFKNARESDLIDMIRPVQEKCCESAQPIIRALLGNRLSRFIDAAINADGRGHFLSQYDGQEVDSDSVEGLPKGKIAFRLN